MTPKELKHRVALNAILNRCKLIRLDEQSLSSLGPLTGILDPLTGLWIEGPSLTLSPLLKEYLLDYSFSAILKLYPSEDVSLKVTGDLTIYGFSSYSTVNDQVDYDSHVHCVFDEDVILTNQNAEPIYLLLLANKEEDKVEPEEPVADIEPNTLN